MLKKFCLLLLSLIILIIPLSAHAMPAPLTRVNSNVKIFEDSNIQIVSYEAYHKVESNLTKTNVTLVLKNTGEDALSRFTIGIPAHFSEDLVPVNEIQVYMDGVQQKLTSRRDITEEDSSFTDIPRNWLTWRFNLEPEEHKVIEFSYETENLLRDDSSYEVYLSFEFLKAWSNTPLNIQFTLDFGDAAPYIFNPNPSFLPHEYDGRGRLTWQYKNNYPPVSIQVPYQSLDHLASEYLNTQANNDPLIRNITESISKKSYDDAIKLIDEYLNTVTESSLKYELLFLKAISHQSLQQHREAIVLFDQLDNQSMFGQWGESFRNRIIFDKYKYMKSNQASNADMYAYMNSAKNNIMDNGVFLMWMEDELKSIEPPPSPKPTPAPSETASHENDDSTKDKENELITSVNIGGYEIAVEIIFIGILILIFVLVLILRRKKRRRNRGYLFK
ncbi:MAG: hypothetical protein GX783_07675 [Clostridiales bacterium]|nr:hypothetical protein [Clostridiales bacterium]